LTISHKKSSLFQSVERSTWSLSHPQALRRGANMKKIAKVAISLASVVATGVFFSATVSAGTASATLSSFIQSGSVTNDSGPGVNLVEVVYSLGTPEDNIATWDSSTAGGTAEDALSDPQYFQTVRWSGLNVAPGDNFNFSNLDIDLIVTLDPLDVTGSTIDNVGTSLRNAFIQASFSDGSVACSVLVEQGWTITQNLTLSEGVSGCGGNAAPEPPIVDEAKPIPATPHFVIALIVVLLSAIGGLRLKRRI
jgi:hypothetical protein